MGLGREGSGKEGVGKREGEDKRESGEGRRGTVIIHTHIYMYTFLGGVGGCGRWKDKGHWFSFWNGLHCHEEKHGHHANYCHDDDPHHHHGEPPDLPR